MNRSIAVEVPQARAFEAFVNMTAWWPLATHSLGETPGRASIVEPSIGGRWYGIDANGVEHGLGRVLAYEPPARLVLSWEVSHGWEYDPSLVTELEIRFIPESPTRTRIELEHRGLEAYGERAEAQVQQYEEEGAWTYILVCYAKVVSPEAA